MILPLTLLVSLFLVVFGIAYVATAARPDRGGAISIAWALVAAYALLLAGLWVGCPGERRAVKLLYASILVVYVVNAAAVAPTAYRKVIEDRSFARHAPALMVALALGMQAVLVWRVAVWLSCGSRARQPSAPSALRRRRRGSAL